jgi:hypothetical protein
MKTAFATLLSLAFTVQGADVVFNLKDFVSTTQPLQKRTVEIQPRFTASSNSTNIITSERRFYNLGTNAVFTVTNMTDGLYWCYAYGLTYTTRFAVNIPATNGTLTASDYLTSTGSGLETENGIPIDLE